MIEIIESILADKFDESLALIGFSGDLGELSEEDARELLNIIMQAAEESAGTS